MARVSVPASAMPSLALIAEHAQSLPALQEAVESIEPTHRSIDEIVKVFATRTNIPIRDARKIINQLLAFDVVRNTLSISPKELFDGLIENLQESPNPDAKKVDLEKLRKIEKQIEDIFSTDHPLGVVSKINRLRFEHANIVIGANIFTDVRPIFDDAGRDIKALSVGYMLEIEYTDRQERRTLFATLDAKDIAKLKAQCERAQTKTITLTEKFKELPWPLIVSGEIADE